MTEYRIGQPLAEGQSPLVLHGDDDAGYRLAAWKPDGSLVHSVYFREGLESALENLNRQIAGWPVGPFTLDDVKAAA